MILNKINNEESFSNNIYLDKSIDSFLNLNKEDIFIKNWIVFYK